MKIYLINNYALITICYMAVWIIGCLSIFADNNLDEVLWQEKIKEKIGYKGIIAKVADTPIFAETIYNKIIPALSKMKRISDESTIVKTGEKLFKKELERAIDTEMVRNYADTKSIIVTDEEVEKELKNTIRRFGGIERLNKYLKKIASNYESFKKELKFNILGKKVYQNIFSSESGFFTENAVDNFVKPDDIKTYYKNNQEEFFIHPRIRAVWIVKEFKNNVERAEIIRYMNAIKTLVKQGYSFYKIHKFYSDEVQPKTIKFYTLDIFDKKLYTKIEKLKKKRGFHILTIDNRIYMLYIKKYLKGKQLSLLDKDVYERIYYSIYNDKINIMITQIKNEIKKTIPIKIFID